MSDAGWVEGLELIENYIHMADITTLPIDKVSPVVVKTLADYLSGTGATKPFSAKNLQRLYQKVFTIKSDERSYLFVQYTSVSPKHGLASAKIRVIFVRWFSTPKGLVYAASVPNNPVTILVFSHLFDRMVQRAFDNDATRLRAIGELFWNNLLSGGYVFTNGAYETQLYTGQGLFLGYGYTFRADNEGDIRQLVAEDLGASLGTGVYSVLVLKTFVKDLRSYQERKKQWMEMNGGYEWKFNLHINGGEK